MLKTLDSSALADYQQAIIDGEIPTRAEAIVHIHALRQFDLPLLGVLRWLPRGNLFIRQHVLLASLYAILQDRERQQIHLGKGYKALTAYTHSGFYLEGWSYLLYCKAAYDFYSRVSGIDNGTVFEPYFRDYSTLMSPEGTIPTNDTRRLDARGLLGGFEVKDVFLHPQYSVFRFAPDIFILITHNTGIMSNRSNGHRNYDFGHFVLYSRGKWGVVHNWYEGYPAKMAGDGGECFAQNIILDGWRTIEPFWRFWPARQLRVSRPAYNRVDLHVGDSVRRFTITPDHLDIEDRGGECSVFNFDDAPQTHTGVSRWEGSRLFLGGKQRSLRVWY